MKFIFGAIAGILAYLYLAQHGVTLQPSTSVNANPQAATRTVGCGICGTSLTEVSPNPDGGSFPTFHLRWSGIPVDTHPGTQTGVTRQRLVGLPNSGLPTVATWLSRLRLRGAPIATD